MGGDIIPSDWELEGFSLDMIQDSILTAAQKQMPTLSHEEPSFSYPLTKLFLDDPIIDNTRKMIVLLDLQPSLRSTVIKWGEWGGSKCF